MTEQDKDLITGALDSLGVALADHKHQWTDGERAIYEEALKTLWNCAEKWRQTSNLSGGRQPKKSSVLCLLGQKGITIKKKIGISDFLTADEVVAAIKIYREAKEGTFARRCAEEIITPILARINKTLGQVNSPLYLAYMVEYVFMQTGVKEKQRKETMNEMEIVTEELAKVDAAPVAAPAMSNQPPPDAKALRTSHIGQLLGQAYQGASTLKLNKQEAKELRADFPDEAVEIRPHDGIIYISHMALRERLWDVFGPTNVAEICRERFIRADTNEVAVDLVLMIRGVFIAEGVGTAKYYPNNPKASFGDTVEAAWSDAIRRCCKKFGVGVQVWRPSYVRDWLAKYAGVRDGRYFRRKPEEAPPTKKVKPTREYTLREETKKSIVDNPLKEPMGPIQDKDDDDDDIPF